MRMGDCQTRDHNELKLVDDSSLRLGTYALIVGTYRSFDTVAFLLNGGYVETYMHSKSLRPRRCALFQELGMVVSEGWNDHFRSPTARVNASRMLQLDPC